MCSWIFQSGQHISNTFKSKACCISEIIFQSVSSLEKDCRGTPDWILKISSWFWIETCCIMSKCKHTSLTGWTESEWILILLWDKGHGQVGRKKNSSYNSFLKRLTCLLKASISVLRLWKISTLTDNLAQGCPNLWTISSWVYACMCVFSGSFPKGRWVWTVMALVFLGVHQTQLKAWFMGSLVVWALTNCWAAGTSQGTACTIYPPPLPAPPPKKTQHLSVDAATTNKSNQKESLSYGSLAKLSMSLKLSVSLCAGLIFINIQAIIGYVYFYGVTWLLAMFYWRSYLV